jgi:hypothetical protein
MLDFGAGTGLLTLGLLPMKSTEGIPPNDYTDALQHGDGSQPLNL